MSNRKRLPGEKAKRVRCKGCKSSDLLEKRGVYNVRVCQRCGRVEPIREAE